MRVWERRGAIASALIGLLGCSGADMTGENTTRGGDNTPVNSGSNAGSNASTGDPGAAGSGDFGNPMMDTMDFSMPFSDGGGVNVTENPDDVRCGGEKFTPEIMMEVIPGNLLLVFDKSGSMRDEWMPGRRKWEDAVAAIPTSLATLADRVNAASVFFPFGEECSVPAAGMAPHIGFMPGPMFLTAWEAFRTATPNPDGGTPLRAALQVADQALQAALPTLTGITTVVVVTDGEPNCVGNNNDDDDTSPNLTPVIANWLTLGVKTYVVGLPGLGGAGLALLNDLAIAGGTTQYIPASDVVTLQTELAKIVSESVTTSFDTCMIPLSKDPPEPNDVNLTVLAGGMEQSVARDLGMSGGWTLDATADNIVLQGALCDNARMGAYDEITVVFGCTEAPPLPPPPIVK